jgi:hypothetical protein
MKVWYSIEWFGIVLFDVVWNEVFTDGGVQFVVFSDVAPCTFVGVLTTLLRSVLPPSSESILFSLSVTLCPFDSLYLKG